MRDALIISSNSRFHTLMILTEKKSARAFYSRIWHKLKRITLSYFDMANSEKDVFGISTKGCSIL